MRKIILASTSPRRIQALELLGLTFEAVASGYEEDMTREVSPRELVAELALGKAQTVAGVYPDALVIGGDTIVVFEKQVMGKPHTPEKAVEMLKTLRGQTHQVMTGLAIIDTATGKTKTDVCVNDVTFRNYSDREISNYVATGEPLDRAGAYAIQGYASLFVKEIRGDYQGVLGLSIATLAGMLRECGVEVWEGILSKKKKT